MAKEIEDIFSKSKIKEICPNPNTPIVLDTREKNSMILSHLHSLKANVIQEKLNIGDYIIGEVTIERKTQMDLINSIKSNRLKEQLKNLKQCTKPILIIEKSKNLYSKIHPNAITGIILSININYSIPIIYTDSEEHTSEILIQIAKREKKETSINANKIPKTIEEQKRFILEAFPGIGPKASKKLLEEFPSLIEIFNAKEEQIKTLLPTKTLDLFIDLLNHS